VDISNVRVVQVKKKFNIPSLRSSSSPTFSPKDF
jgi:hypothetical protein